MGKLLSTSNQILIRQAKVEDIPILVRLYLETFDEERFLYQAGPRFLHDVFEGLIEREPELFLVAETHGKIVGFRCATSGLSKKLFLKLAIRALRGYYNPAANARFFLRNINFCNLVFRKSPCKAETLLASIDPGYQSTGLASSMLMRLFRTLRAKGHRKVHSKIEVNNTRSLIHFLKNGFRPESIANTPTGKMLLLVKSLDDLQVIPVVGEVSVKLEPQKAPLIQVQ